MLVYNTGIGVAGAGVYVWITDKWCKASTVAYTGSASIQLVNGSFQREELMGDVIAAANSNTTTIAADKVTSAKIKDGEVKTDDLATGAVTAEKLAQMSAKEGQVLQYDGEAWKASTLMPDWKIKNLPSGEYTVVLNGEYSGPALGTYLPGMPTNYNPNWNHDDFSAYNSPLVWSPVTITARWHEARAYCTNGWRLPNLKEALELYKKAGLKTQYDTGAYHFYADVVTTNRDEPWRLFWTETESSGEVAYAFDTGYGTFWAEPKTSGHTVRCVRPWRKL
jgi:hypothetical protein